MDYEEESGTGRLEKQEPVMIDDSCCMNTASS
jgi:hypothetical protein